MIQLHGDVILVLTSIIVTVRVWSYLNISLMFYCQCIVSACSVSCKHGGVHVVNCSFQWLNFVLKCISVSILWFLFCTINNVTDFFQT